MKSNSEIRSIRNKKQRCFRCNRLFFSYFINKNNIWGYWTGKEEDKEKFIDDSCIRGFYLVRKEEMLKEVKDPKKRVRLKNYVIFEAQSKILTFIKANNVKLNYNKKYSILLGSGIEQ